MRKKTGNASETMGSASTPISTSESPTPPESGASFFSKVLYMWAQPIFNKATERYNMNQGLEQVDLLQLTDRELGSNVGPIFENSWKEQQQQQKLAGDGSKQGKEASVSRALRAALGKEFMIAGIIKVFNTGLQFTYPLLFNLILRFIEETQQKQLVGGSIEGEPWNVTYKGYWLSGLLFLAMAAKAMTENMYFHLVHRASRQARVAVSVSIYKALRLTSAERHGTTLGEMVNLMQVDAFKIEMFIPQCHVLWDGLFQIVGYLTILYTLIGWPCFAGLGVMILTTPIQGVIMKTMFGLNRGIAKFTDDRVNRTNEAIQGIRCVKMYTWEESFQKVIKKGRKSELNMMKRMAYLRGAAIAIMDALPGIVAVVSFIVYATAYSGTVSAPTLFAALVAFGQLRFPLILYPMALAMYAQASVSTNRVKAFLSLKEVRNDKRVYNREDDSLPPGSISMQNVKIYWSDPDSSFKQANKDSEDHDGSMLSSSNNTHLPSGSQSSEEKNNSKNTVDDSKVPLESYNQPILSDVSLNVVPGELLAIIGRVGSGKSTLSSAMLNEAVIGEGSIALNGSIAYAAQKPWILNATLRDNITFGNAFDQLKYDKIIQACQLIHDLSLLEMGDMTEIGENGINLSGGQQQRVSIARAAYADADIIIMDDPLSALDPEVGKRLFDECILKFMKNKTRILVTNQLQFLHFCDTVTVLDQGRIKEQGTFDDLSKDDNGEVRKLLQDLEMASNNGGNTKSENNAESSKKKDKQGKVGEITDGVPDPSSSPEKKSKNTGLVSEEERNVGAVSTKVYRKYINAGGGFLMFSLTIFMYVVCIANELLNTLWITFWTSDANYERRPQEFYLGYYALSSCTAGLFVFFRSITLTRFGVRAARELHRGLLVSILNAPMSFFDTTPTGRILSRFSKDMYSVDLEVTENMDFTIFGTLGILVAFSTIIVVTPWFGIAVVPIVLLYIKVLNYFRKVSRETKRLESISRSPVYVHFSETLGGIGTIQAYNQAARFINDFELKVDMNTQASYNNITADRWLGVRLELLGTTITGLAAVFACSVVTNQTTSLAGNSGNNFASIAGLSLHYALSITSSLNWLVRSFAKMEASMNAAERILYYSEEIPQEAPTRSKDLSTLLQTNTNLSKNVDDNANLSSPSSPLPLPPTTVAIRAKGGPEKPSSNWPSKGGITLRNLMMRYRPENPLVIKGLDVEIEGGSRVGVVGRTGSGKSSLLLVLLRIVEPTLADDDDYVAPISVDDVDILRIGLRDLRSAIGIIPQNPVLFSGTIRSNIDPFSEHTDKDIWNALEGCGMKKTVEEMRALLDAPVAEYGSNLSQGQRQLLCLGRALLKNCRILMLDEATSSVDYETDKEIQRTLRTAFAGCTVLTIAHRVNTIMDSDKIMVMVDGKIGEFAAPSELLADKNSIFSKIVQHSGTESN